MLDADHRIRDVIERSFADLLRRFYEWVLRRFGEAAFHAFEGQQLHCCVFPVDAVNATNTVGKYGHKGRCVRINRGSQKRNTLETLSNRMFCCCDVYEAR